MTDKDELRPVAWGKLFADPYGGWFWRTRSSAEPGLEPLYPQSAIDALRARLEAAERASRTAIAEMSNLALKLGESEGKLRASELVGVVDGWIERAKAAEARLTKAEELLRKLAAEVVGLEAFEGEVRDIIGNTNWAVLAHHRENARSFLQEPTNV